MLYKLMWFYFIINQEGSDPAILLAKHTLNLFVITNLKNQKMLLFLYLNLLSIQIFKVKNYNLMTVELKFCFHSRLNLNILLHVKTQYLSLNVAAHFCFKWKFKNKFVNRNISKIQIFIIRLQLILIYDIAHYYLLYYWRYTRAV